MEKRNFTQLSLGYLMLTIGLLFSTIGISQTCTAPNQCMETPGFPDAPAAHACPTSNAVVVFTETFDNGFGVFTEDAPPGPGTTGANDLTVSTAGDTPSSSTGPETTPGCDNGVNDGEFIFLEGSFTAAGQIHCMTGNIAVPAASATVGAPFTMSFWHHMFGGWIGDLEIFINGTSSYLVSGQQQTANCQPWDQGSIDVTPFAGTTIAVQICMSEATTGTGFTWTSDISIDHLQIFGTQPLAVCGNTTVDLVGGTYTLTAADIAALTAGSGSCGPVTITVDPTTFDCSNLGGNPVTVTVDDAGVVATCVANVTVLPDLTCPPPDITNEAPVGINFGSPDIADPCTCLGDGVFGEEVVIGPDIAGGGWVVASTDLVDPSTGMPYPAGFPLTAVPDPANPGLFYYILEGTHLTAEGYSIVVTSPLWGDLSFSNTCFAVQAELLSSLGVTCLNTTAEPLNARVFSEMSNGMQVDVEASTSAGFTINGNPATIFDPMVLGIGSHLVEFCFDAGTTLGFKVKNGVVVGPPESSASIADAAADPACEVCLSQVVNVGETPDVFACNDVVQISAAENCATDITPDMLLEGGHPNACFDDYVVSTGNVPNPIPSRYFGQEVVATVTHLISGNSCWSKVIVEDKWGPDFICEIDLLNKAGVSIDMDGVLDANLSVTCDVDLASIPAPAATDNCDPSPFVFLVDETTTNFGCDNYTVTRTYGSKDIYGNAGRNCTITINVAPPAVVEFPDDITWTCQQYEAFANVIDATELHPLILAEAANMDQALSCCIPGTGGDDVVGLAPYNPPAMNILTPNAGFEMGDFTGWLPLDFCGSANTVFTGVNYNNGLSNVSPTEGNSMAVNEFAGINGAGCATLTLRQFVTIPAGTSSLSFDYNAGWDLTACAGCAAKTATFQIIPQFGGPILFQDANFVEAIPGTSNQGSWQTYTVDLSPFAGQVVQIEVVEGIGPQPVPSPGHFALDNFQLIAGSTVPYWLDGEDLDVSLDPRYNDDIDNPITDGNPACNTTTAETDENECVANFSYMVGCPYLADCDIAPPTAHAPELVKVPIYQPPLAPPFSSNDIKRGLEDVDVLETTGSGQPNVVGSNCHFAVTHEDEVLEACPGADQSKVFKILRTWTVLNWCTGQVFTDVQVIKVLDKKPPVITFNDDDNNDGDLDPEDLRANGDEIGGFGNDDGYADQLFSDQYNSGAHSDCRSSGLIDVPSFMDDCSGISEIRVFTPAGQATPVEQNGEVVGYRIPAPYLEMGIHTITFEAVDFCGNRTTADKQIEVIDGIPPTNICREFTQIALAGIDDGVTAVDAADFDEGSYDFCSPVYFKVKRMERFECDKANVDTPDEIRDATRTNDDQEWFDDKVKFCCEDKGDTVIVILRVYDFDPGVGSIRTSQSATTGFSHSGRINGTTVTDRMYNDCMIEVVVEDKVRPDCTPPAEVWANCTDLPDNIDYSDIDQLTDLFGSAIASDNCGATIEELNPNVQVDLCGSGRVIRRFRAEDACGNRSLGNCQQLIAIQPILDYRLLVPGDFEEECDDASPQDFEYEELACDLFAINSEDVVLPASSQGECRKIIRTWTLINWCEYDGFSDPVSIPRRDLNLDGRPGDGEGGSNNPVTGVRFSSTHVYTYAGNVLILNDNPLVAIPSGGYYTYDQHIKIFDNTAPDVSYNGDTEFCGGDLDEDPCTGEVNIDPEIDDLCTDTDHRWELTAFSATFNTADFAGDGNLTGRFPLGTHTVRFYVTDECGNLTQFDVTFEVVDCKAPTPVCHNGLSIDVMPASGMVELWAIDFDASSFDYCHPLKFRINRVEDRNNDGFITSDDYIDNVPQFDSIQLTCANVGTLTNVQLWVGEESTDSQNNWDYCVTYVEVQDNNGACGNLRPASIAGTAKTDLGTAVSNVDVTISGGMNSTLTTDNSGAFTFNALTQGGDYSVTPMRNDDVRNGVSTYDLALISKHVLSVELLDSPYKMLAADANRSGNISTLDLVAIRKVILWVANDFPGNTSWRFVDKDQILNSTNPFADAIKEVKNFNNITGAETANFVAVKVGDVSGDAEPQDLGSIDDRTFNGTFLFNAKDIAFQTGDRVEVEFTSEELNTILGYQFTMNFDNKVVDLIEIQEATANQQNFGQSMIADGILTASWNGNATTNSAFKLVFNAKQAGTLSEVISISSEYTQAEAYTTNGEMQNVGINFGTTTATADFALYQNTPNPFKGETTIGFNLPEAAAATITVSDVSGKVIKVVDGDFVQGYNMITLNSDNLANGVLYYQLDTDNFTATKKMIIIE